MTEKVPRRVRLLVLGGGIHGVGVLHDLASRGWRDICLVEKKTLASGTSSRSTKLIHGGLRYLQRLSSFGLVRECLQERHFLLEHLRDIVNPIEIILPLSGEGLSPFKVGVGLWLYDRLSGHGGIHPFETLRIETLREKVPHLELSLIKKAYSFWDAQTDDLALVQRVASSALQLGATVFEGMKAKKIWPDEEGWRVLLEDKNGHEHEISALYIVNAMGPWAHEILEQSQITPTHRAIKNKGIHLVFPDIGLKSGLMLESPTDKRVIFLLPWLNKTLVGTTESAYDSLDLDKISCEPAEISYLLAILRRYFGATFQESQIETTFAGVRWLGLEAGQNISTTSREVEIGEIHGKRGKILTIYGGKLTSYRILSRTIGDRITSHFGELLPSQTHLPQFWSRENRFVTPEVGKRWAL